MESSSRFQDPEFKLKCLNDFSFFVENVLGFELSDFHREQISYLLEEDKHLCIVNPVGHSKTTIFSISFPLWKLWSDPEVKICLVSSSLDQSKKILAQVQHIAQTNPFFKDMLPSDRRTSWNKMELKTAKGGQYFIKPFNATIRGIHVDYLILDDILRDEEITQEQAKDIFWGPVWTRVQTVGGKIIIVGTPQSADDLFADIEKKSKQGLQWRFVRKPAVIVDPVTGEWKEPLWKERFTLEELEAIKENMGPSRFAREYMCDPIATGSNLFPSDMIAECLDDKLGFTYECKGEVTIGVDLAMSSSPTGDYSVFTVVDSFRGTYIKNVDGIEVEVKDPVIVRRIERYKGLSYQAHQNIAERLYRDFNAKKMIVDSSTFGAAFIQDLRARQMHVDGQSFLREERNSLLLNLRRIIESGRLVLPFAKDDTFAYNIMKIVIKELSGIEEAKTPRSEVRTFRSNLAHDDTVMSLALAVRDVRTPKPISVLPIYTESDLVMLRGE